MCVQVPVQSRYCKDGSLAVAARARLSSANKRMICYFVLIVWTWSDGVRELCFIVGYFCSRDSFTTAGVMYR